MKVVVSKETENYYDYAFDGEVDSYDYSQYLQGSLTGLKSDFGGMASLELGMNTVANIFKRI